MNEENIPAQGQEKAAQARIQAQDVDQGGPGHLEGKAIEAAEPAGCCAERMRLERSLPASEALRWHLEGKRCDQLIPVSYLPSSGRQSSVGRIDW